MRRNDRLAHSGSEECRLLDSEALAAATGGWEDMDYYSLSTLAFMGCASGELFLPELSPWSCVAGATVGAGMWLMGSNAAAAEPSDDSWEE